MSIWRPGHTENIPSMANEGLTKFKTSRRWTFLPLRLLIPSRHFRFIKPVSLPFFRLLIPSRHFRFIKPGVLAFLIFFCPISKQNEYTRYDEGRDSDIPINVE